MSSAVLEIMEKASAALLPAYRVAEDSPEINSAVGVLEACIKDIRALMPNDADRQKLDALRKESLYRAGTHPGNLNRLVILKEIVFAQLAIMTGAAVLPSEELEKTIAGRAMIRYQNPGIVSSGPFVPAKETTIGELTVLSPGARFEGGRLNIGNQVYLGPSIIEGDFTVEHQSWFGRGKYGRFDSKTGEYTSVKMAALTRAGDGVEVQGGVIGPQGNFGDGCKVGAGTSAKEHLVIKNNVTVGENNNFEEHCVIGGPVGDGNRFGKACYINSTGSVGNDNVIGAHCEINGSVANNTTLGDYVVVVKGAIVTDGQRLPDHTIVSCVS